MMEPSNRLIPPHLNAETYRMETSGTYTHAYLDFVRVHKDGHILVGCSELTGRYWNGGACILPNDQESSFQKTNFKRDINLTSTTADGCFSGSSDKVILCEDTGAISIWSKCEDAWSTWKEDLSVAEHDGPALVIECLDSDRLYVSAGGDGNVKVWDIRDNMICLHNYNSAHSMQVNTIGVKPMSQKHFVTGSLDGFISLWDEHTNKPVYDVITNNCGVRCLLWIEENKLLFGDESGQLSLVDLRDMEQVIKLHEFPAPVHKIAFNPRSGNVAVCCDNQILSVFHIDGDKLYPVHERKAHQDCIRGLAWDESEPNAIHTVGWDGELKKHIIHE